MSESAIPCRRKGQPRCTPSVWPVYHYSWKQRSTCSSGRASGCHPHVCSAYPSAGCARKADPSHACRRTPLLPSRVNRADAATVAALRHACSEAARTVRARQAAPLHACRGALTSEFTAWTLLRINGHCHSHFSSLQFTGGSTAIATSALSNSLADQLPLPLQLSATRWKSAPSNQRPHGLVQVASA